MHSEKRTDRRIYKSTSRFQTMNTTEETYNRTCSEETGLSNYIVTILVEKRSALLRDSSLMNLNLPLRNIFSPKIRQ